VKPPGFEGVLRNKGDEGRKFLFSKEKGKEVGGVNTTDDPKIHSHQRTRCVGSLAIGD